MAEQEKKKSDLKELDLATGVDKIPEFWNRHGNKVLIVITIAALSYALFTFRRNTSESARINAETNLATARELLVNLRSPQLFAIRPEDYANIRRDVLREGTTRMGEVLTQSSDPNYRSQALILQGDLYYTVAMLPEMEESTTRPALKLEQTSDQLLESARTSYQDVVDRFADKKQAFGSAKLGLAAIAENTAKFDDAKVIYQAISDDATLSTSVRNVAKQRLAILPNLSRPMRLAKSSTQPAATPTTNPDTTTIAPATLPTTAPAQP